jgi:hypothetical protein
VPKKSVFLDANIIADYILVHQRIQEAIREGDDPQATLEIIAKEHSAPLPAYKIVEHALKGGYKRHRFLTSQLAIAETVRVITLEYFYRVWHKKGIPLRYWSQTSMGKLPADEKTQLNAAMNEFTGAMNIHAGKFLMIAPEYFDFKIIGPLMWNYSCEVQDAVLISTAINQKCKLFVTEDHRLTRKVNVFRHDFVKHPQTFISDYGPK